MKYVVFLLLIILSSSVYATTYCLQELINETSACGGRSGGNYSISSGGFIPSYNNLQDKNPVTYGNGSAGNYGWGDMYIQPPIDATGLILEFTDSNGIHNETLNASCWNANSIHVMRESLNGFSATYQVNYYCYNPTLLVMWNGTKGANFISINETRLYWLMPDTTTTIPTTTTATTSTTLSAGGRYNVSQIGSTIPGLGLQLDWFLMLVALVFITATIFVLGGMGQGPLGMLVAIAEADFFVFVFNWLSAISISLLLLLNIVAVMSWMRRSH